MTNNVRETSLEHRRSDAPIRSLSLSSTGESLFVRQRLAMLASKEDGSWFERLTPLIEAGQVVPSIDRTHPLDQVPDAMSHLEAGRVRGKVAITIHTEEGSP
jgi:NADPH:quinone reductase-like Zn-dependent oxidoreductase